MKGPKADDFTRSSDLIESRKFTIFRRYVEPPSSVVLDTGCPFCKARVKVYLWSLSGGGKRCKCGAFFGSSGMARHWKKYSEKTT